ncbi:transcription termination factor NusA [bacterium]|nr:transcription termination factor NusA [bacterium]
MNSQILEAVNYVAKQKNIGRDKISEMIKEIFVMMIKKRYKFPDTFDVIVNIDKGEVEIFQEMDVVEEVMDPDYEISLETARKEDPDYAIGDTYVKFIDPEEFGRRSISTAKQTLKQRIRDIEKENIINEYQKRIGEIIIGDVNQIKKDKILLNYDKIEVVLPFEEQIRNERFKRGQSVRVVILRVENDPKAPEIVVSRAHESFLVRLFELEVPEISDGIIEIRGVAREPGVRAKIAVESTDRRIDPVGACVGQRGVRIQSIVRELNGEKIDIVPWDADITKFILNTMAVAKPIDVKVDTRKRTATVVIEDDNVAIAVGKNRQNIELACRLTGFDIEILSTSERKKSLKLEMPDAQQILESFNEYNDDDEFEDEESEELDDFDEDVYVEDLPGIQKDWAVRLNQKGIATIDDVLNLGKEKFMKLDVLSKDELETIYNLINESYGDYETEE